MAATVPVPSRFQFSSTTGVALSGGSVDVFLAGTTTRSNTWSDRAQTSLNTNPIVLDSSGSCSIFVDPAKTYKFVVKNSAGVVQSHLGGDNISGAASATAIGDALAAAIVDIQAQEATSIAAVAAAQATAEAAVGALVTEAETARDGAEAAEAQAELYAAAAAAGSVIFYDTIALGLAGTASGSTFGVKAGGSDGLTRPTVYRDDAGVATLLYAIVPGSEYDADVQRWNVIGGEPDALQAADTTTTAGHVIFNDAVAYSGIPRITLFGGSAGGSVTVRAFTRSGTTWTLARDLGTVSVPAAAEVQLTGTAAINAGEYVGFLIGTNGVAYRSTPTSRAVRSGGYVNGSGGMTTFATGTVVDTKEPQVRVEVLAPIIDGDTLDDIKSRLAGVQYAPQVAAYVAGRSAAIAAGNPTTYGGARTVIYKDPIAIGGLLRLQVYGGPNSGRARVRRYTFNGTHFDKVGQDIPVANIVANSLNVIETDAIVNAGDYVGLTFDDQTVSIDTALAIVGNGFYLYSAGGAEVNIIATSFQASTDQLAIRFEVYSRTSASSSTNTTVFLGDSILATSSNVINNVYGAARGENTVNGGMGGTKIASTYAVGDVVAQYLAPLSVAAICECIGTGDFTPLETAADALYTYSPSLDYRSIVDRIAAVDWNTVGKIIVFAGTNDFGGSGPIGSATDTLPTAGVRGAINSISANVLGTYPEMQIFFVSPTWRSRIAPGDGQDVDTVPNSLGLYLRDYVSAIIDQANACKLPALDFYKNSGINKTNASVAIPDGLHPGGATWNGRIGAKIAAWISSVAA